MQGAAAHWSVSIDPSTGSHDKLFVSGNRVVWFNGLDPSSKAVKISYTMETNILQAFWCQFEIARNEKEDGGYKGTCLHIHRGYEGTCSHNVIHRGYKGTCSHIHRGYEGTCSHNVIHRGYKGTCTHIHRGYKGTCSHMHTTHACPPPHTCTLPTCSCKHTHTAACIHILFNPSLPKYLTSL